MFTKDLTDLLSAYNTVYWDWNGTLINDVDICVDITNSFLEKKGVATISKDFYLKSFTIPVIDYYKKLNIEKHGITFEEITESFVSGYIQKRHLQPLYQGSKELLNALSESNVTQVVLSAAHIDELHYQMKRHELEGLFDHISGSSDYSAGCKLERGLKLKEDFGDGIMVGDTIHDIEIGKKMGLKTVWVSQGHQCYSLAKSHSDIDYIFDRRSLNLQRSR